MFTIKFRLTKCSCPHHNGGKARPSCPYYKGWGDSCNPLCGDCIEGLTWEVKMFDDWGESWDASLGFLPLFEVWEINRQLAEYIKVHLPAPKYIRGEFHLPIKGELSLPAERERELTEEFFWWKKWEEKA